MAKRPRALANGTAGAFKKVCTFLEVHLHVTGLFILPGKQALKLCAKLHVKLRSAETCRQLSQVVHELVTKMSPLDDSVT